jgi:hypothetical protein
MKDFTIENYKHLLRLALQYYTPTSFNSLNSNSKFILWRHDIDISINRGLRLAQINAELGIKSTFFLSLHSQFYNLFEKNQIKKLIEINNFGHDIGLHFDTSVYQIKNRINLETFIAHEKEVVSNLLNLKLVAISFHNPSESDLRFEDESYSELINTYSKKLKDEVEYCSDSNGYWKYKKLEDVILSNSPKSLQVLIHPEWWQENFEPPRTRIHRAVYGRARQCMSANDSALESFRRQNLRGHDEILLLIKPLLQEDFMWLDFLWNERKFDTLLLEVWKIHKRQLNRFLKVILIKNRKLSASEINLFLSSQHLSKNLYQLLTQLGDEDLRILFNNDIAEFNCIQSAVIEMISSENSMSQSWIEEKCVYIVKQINKLSTWGSKQEFAYDGFSSLKNIGIKISEFGEQCFKEEIEESIEDTQRFIDDKLAFSIWISLKNEILNNENKDLDSN